MSLGLAVAAGAGMALLLLRARWNYTRLPVLSPVPAAPRPDVSVVIPARNQADSIKRAARGLAPARVYVIDDHSTDKTALRAREAGATVIPAPPLPPGFACRPHACWSGARATQSEWILFAGARAWYAPGFLEALLHSATRDSAEVALVLLRQHCASVAESLLLPCALAMHFCGSGGRAPGASNAILIPGSGHCLLFRRSAYNAIGGHAAVMGSAIEDADLIRVAKRHHLAVCTYRAEELGSVRPFQDLPSLALGLQRSIRLLLRASPRAGACILAAAALLGCWAPALFLLALERQWAALAVLAALPSLLLMPWYGSPARALLAPLAIYTFEFLVLRGLLAGMRRHDVKTQDDTRASEPSSGGSVQ